MCKDGKKIYEDSRIATGIKTKPVDKKTYYGIRDYVGSTILQFSEKKRDTMIKCVVKAYEKEGIFPDEGGILNISVSFDGSWLVWVVS